MPIIDGNCLENPHAFYRIKPHHLLLYGFFCALIVMVYTISIRPGDKAFAEQKGQWAWPGDKFIVKPINPALNLEKEPEVFCTVGFPATDNNHDRLFITAGHCGRKGDQIFSVDELGNKKNLIGHIMLSATPHADMINNIDVAIVQVDSGRSLHGTNYHIEYSYHPSDPVTPHTLACLHDDISGLNCGLITQSAYNHDINFTSGRTYQYRVIPSTMCSTQGDSGAAVYSAHGALGIVSANYPGGTNCHQHNWLNMGLNPKKKESTVISYITLLQDITEVAKQYFPGFTVV